MVETHTLLSLTPRETSTAIVIPSSEQGPRLDVSYAELRVLVLSLRDVLRGEGVGPGDVVAMSLVNGLEFVVGFLSTGAAR